MSELVWINGQIIPLSDARVSIEDRGFQFADGVYEALELHDGRPFALMPHLDRLENSCRGMKLPMPLGKDSLASEIMKLAARSGVREGVLYLQLTRGAAPRNHRISPEIKPTLLFYARPCPPAEPIDSQTGAKIISVRDERWRKCWIKSIGLSASVLARMQVDAAVAEEGAFVDEAGLVAECTSSNLFFVIDDALLTHPVGERVLPGITRQLVIECAKKLGIDVIERPVHIDQAKRAAEIFITSTTRHIMWVKFWDERVGQSRCGPTTRRLSAAFEDLVRKEMAGLPLQRQAE